MPNLYDVLADAQHGEAMASLSDEFGLTPQQTQAAVASLLPAISMGLKRSTATPEGLGNLLALMAQQPDIYALYDDRRVAFSPEGRAAGNAVLSTMFGSPEASRAIAAKAQKLSGVTSAILKKLLPVIVGMIISGLMRSGSGRAAPQAPQPSPDQGGGLIDILRQIFRQSPQPDTADQTGSSPWGIPPIGDILGRDRGGTDNATHGTSTRSERRAYPSSNGLRGTSGPRQRRAWSDPARTGERDQRGARQAGDCRSLRDRHFWTVRPFRLWPNSDPGRRHSRPNLARYAWRQGRSASAAWASLRDRLGHVR
jgi:hypothetical protein